MSRAGGKSEDGFAGEDPYRSQYSRYKTGKSVASNSSKHSMAGAQVKGFSQLNPDQPYMSQIVEREKAPEGRIDVASSKHRSQMHSQMSKK